MKQLWHINIRQVRVQLSWLVLFAAVAIPVTMAAPDPGKQPPPAPAKEPADRKAPAGTVKKPTAPAPTFTPSEQIGAGSAVSFPVDI